MVTTREIIFDSIVVSLDTTKQNDDGWKKKLSFERAKDQQAMHNIFVRRIFFLGSLTSKDMGIIMKASRNQAVTGMIEKLFEGGIRESPPTR